MQRTIIIAIGIACALLTAAGIMFNPISSAFRQLHDKNQEVRAEAIAVLSRIDRHSLTIEYKSAKPLHESYDKRALVEIRRALNVEKDFVRATAILGLVSLGDDESIPAIRKMLTDTDDFVCINAARALAKFNDTASIPAIRKLLYQEDSRDMMNIIEVLQELGDNTVIDEIRKLAKNDNVNIKAAAVHCLGPLGDKESIPEIRELLNAHEPELLYSAIISLGILGDKESISKIKRYLNNDDKEFLKSRSNPMFNLCKEISQTAETALRKLGVSDAELELLRRDREHTQERNEIEQAKQEAK